MSEIGIYDLLRAERLASVETFAAKGPDASTRCRDWTVRDLVGHLLIQDQGRGVPMLLTAPLGMTMLRLGVRAPSRFADRMASQHEKVLADGWDAALERLAAGPPRAVGLPVFGSLRLHENWIHHEDARRVDPVEPRPSSADVDDHLWAALGWYGPYQRKVLGDTELVLVRDSGETRHLGGDGPRVVVAGPAGELALVVAGRGDASTAEFDGDSAATARLRDPALSL